MTEVKLTTILLMAGALLLCLTFAWFFFFLPLGCVMNPTGCKEQFPVFGPNGLLHLWLSLAVASLLIIVGLRR